MKAIIFDFYGTLAWISKKNSTHWQLFRNLPVGTITYEGFRELLMCNAFDSFSEISLRLGVSALNLEDLAISLDKEIASVKLFKEVPEVLEQLSKKYELYLLSNLATPFKKPFYELGLNQWIQEPFFSCDLGLMKPSPEVFQKVLQSINYQPEEVLMVGDSYQADIVGAKSCGIPTVWIRRGKQTNEQSIQSLDDVGLV